MKKVIFFLVLLIFVANSSALLFYSAECFKDGHIEVKVNAWDNESKVYTSSIKTKIDGIEIDGDWGVDYLRRSSDGTKQYGVLETDEAMFNENKIYDVEISYYIEDDPQERIITGKADCPGLRFSCALLNLSVENCNNREGKFIATLTIHGLHQSSVAYEEPDVAISYTLITEDKYTDSGGFFSKRGGLPEGYTIYDKGHERYVIEAPLLNTKVKKFYARFNINEFYGYCDESDYPNISFHSDAECDKNVEELTVVKEDKPIKEDVGEIEDIVEEVDVSENIVEGPEIEPKAELKETGGSIKLLGLITVLIVIIVIGGMRYLKKKGHM